MKRTSRKIKRRIQVRKSTRPIPDQIESVQFHHTSLIKLMDSPSASRYDIYKAARAFRNSVHELLTITENTQRLAWGVYTAEEQ